MLWNSVVPKIQNNVTAFNEEGINPIIQALENRTNILKQQIVKEAVLEGVSFTDIGLTNCKKGQFIAYDNTLKTYVPANCVWDAYNSTPSESSYIIGVVISDIADDQGTILISGIIKDQSLISTIINNNAYIPGTYYLGSEGKVTSDVSSVSFPIRCGTLTSTGCFIVDIQTPDFRTHNHTKHELHANNWKKPSNDSLGADVIAYYELANDLTAATIFSTLSEGLSIVMNGSILIEDVDYRLTSKHILLLNPEFGSTELLGYIFATHPFMGNVADIKSINVADGNNIVTVSKVGNTAVIDTHFDKKEGLENNGIAVSSIDNDGVTYCNIINEIQATKGISVSSVKGVATLSLSDNQNTKLNMDIINSNGVIFTGTDVVMFKFPKDRTSSLVGNVKLPEFAKGMTARVFLWVQGSGSATPAGKVYVKQINFDYSAKEANIPNTSTGLNLSTIGATEDRIAYYWETSNGIEINGSGLLSITVEFTNPDVSVNCLHIGVSLSDK